MALLERSLAEATQHLSRTGRPLVTLSYAQSIDGSLSLSRGAPAAISGPDSLVITHQLRSLHAAIMVGIGTVLADDPQLNVRHAGGRDPQPVIVDSRLRTPPSARLFQKEPKPWLFCLNSADARDRQPLEAAGARIFQQEAQSGQKINLPALLDQLGQLGVNSLMVEGGARLITSFLKEGLADQAAITIAPRWLGGLRAVEESLAAADNRFPTLLDPQIERAGDDFILWGQMGHAAL
jgi:3,4-dihydroxy 2-butanone 4-phosphate synthase/GTP cyclohydrolase II